MAGTSCHYTAMVAGGGWERTRRRKLLKYHYTLFYTRLHTLHFGMLNEAKFINKSGGFLDFDTVHLSRQVRKKTIGDYNIV